MNQYDLPNVWGDAFVGQYQKYCMTRAARLFREYTPNPDTWKEERDALRDRVAKAMNLHYDHSLPLDYCEYGEPIQADGYSIKRVTYTGAPGRTVTASLFIPEGEGPFPGVLVLHGHSAKARLWEFYQSLGHVLAKRGYVALAVDYIGAGERSDMHGNFYYHGGLCGTTMFNAGYPIMGIEVTDNMRGIDLLQSLPFVESDKIGVTGCSGGGNQTMWVAAMDDRIQCAVPVVSVGSFESYMQTENCICEVLPGGLTICEESSILALVAPRALYICNALYDSCYSFSVPEMVRSYENALKIFKMYGCPENINYRAFRTPHGYKPVMRCAMLGVMDRFLKGEGHGDPVDEGIFNVLPEMDLCVYEKGKRPEQFGTYHEICNNLGKVYDREVEIERNQPGFAEKKIDALKYDVLKMQRDLNIDSDRILCHGTENGWKKYTLVDGKTNLLTPVLTQFHSDSPRDIYVVSGDRDRANIERSPLFLNLRKKGSDILYFDAEDTGETGMTDPQVCVHHLTVRIALWHGEILQGVWAEQYFRIAMHLRRKYPEATLHFCSIGSGTTIPAMLAGHSFENACSVLERACPTFNFYERETFSQGVMSRPYDESALTLANLVPGIMKWGNFDLAVDLLGKNATFLNPVYPDNTPVPPDVLH